MATTERGIYYTTSADDSATADFNVITKAIADSAEAALDTLDAGNLDANRIAAGVTSVAFGPSGSATIGLPTSPTGRWSVRLQAVGQAMHATTSGVYSDRVNVSALNGNTLVTNATVIIHWQAIAY